jgi:hypothetical protein
MEAEEDAGFRSPAPYVPRGPEETINYEGKLAEAKRAPTKKTMLDLATEAYDLAMTTGDDTAIKKVQELQKILHPESDSSKLMREIAQDREERAKEKAQRDKEAHAIKMEDARIKAAKTRTPQQTFDDFSRAVDFMHQVWTDIPKEKKGRMKGALVNAMKKGGVEFLADDPDFAPFLVAHTDMTMTLAAIYEPKASGEGVQRLSDEDRRVYGQMALNYTTSNPLTAKKRSDTLKRVIASRFHVDYDPQGNKVASEKQKIFNAMNEKMGMTIDWEKLSPGEMQKLIDSVEMTE